jgi:hypothetical protein
MSYTYAAPLASKDHLDGDLHAAGAGAPTQFSDPDAADAVSEHVTAIHEAAMRLAEVVGRPEDNVSVHVSGHANPGHGPRDGYADEMITLTVTAKPASE